MRPNRLKVLLQEGKFTCGSWLTLCDPVRAVSIRGEFPFLVKGAGEAVENFRFRPDVSGG